MAGQQQQPAPSSTGAYREYASYWSIVWEQFVKNRPSYFALWAVVGLFALAIYAPVGASKLPFVWMDDRGVAFPWVRALLFNRNVYASSIDLFFNLLLVLSPFYVGVGAWVRRRKARMTFQNGVRLVRTTLLVGIGATLALFLVMLLIDPRIALLDYRTLSEAGEGWGIFPPLRIQYDDTLHGVEGTGIHHLMGKDNAGRDIFVRLIFGTRVSLSVGVIAVGIYISIGTVLGALSGFFGGKIDLAVQRLLEIFLCFPSFFMILTFIGFLPRPSITWVMVIIGLVGWPGPARLVRGEFLRLKGMDFVAAARACGLSDARIIFRHILPNAIGPLLVNATFGVAASVLVESSLSFLGLGDPTMPSWGRLLAFGRESGSTSMMLIAGFAIFVTVSVFNLAGEGIRDALDPKLRK
jgi:peptide/nickel transport system permease protein